MICKLAPSLLFLGFFLATSAALRAQTDPNLEQGFKPYGTFHGGDIDSVSMTNGNLNLHIPLFSLPQRGKLHLGYSLFYTNKTYTPHTVCDASGICTDYLDWYGNSATGASGVSVAADAGLLPHLTIIKSTHTNPTIYLQSELTPDGASHQAAVPSAGGTRSVDGTGLLGSLDQDGIRYVGTCAASMEDPNGNQTCANGTGQNYQLVSDTLGRAIPASSTNDYTGCTGPLSFSSATIWSVPGPSGTTSSFKFCYAQVPVVIVYDLTDGTQTNGTVPMLQSVVLPNKTTWTFTYSNDLNGNLTQITFPTGGTLAYTWAGGAACSTWSSAPGGQWVATRTLNANDGTGAHTWTYTWSDLGTSASNILKDPLNNETVYTVTGLGGGCSYYITSEGFYQGSHTDLPPGFAHGIIRRSNLLT